MVVPAMVGMPMVQVVARVLSTVVELLAIEVVGKTAGKVGEHEKVATSMLALPEVAYPSGVLPMVTGDSSNGRLYDSLPRVSRMLDLLPGRPIDCLTQSL